MKPNVFKFKYFSVKQDKSAMKIGTDGTLLGAWCNCKNSKTILDIGTGTGLIALMLAQRNSNATIDAIELDIDSSIESKYNFEHSDWSSRLNLTQVSFQDFETNRLYDLIVSNPPFFSNSSKNDSKTKSNTRHNDSLPFDVLIQKSKALLSETGKLCVILPIDESNKFIALSLNEGLSLTKRTEVFSNVNSKTPFRYIMEFSKHTGKLIEDKIIIETEIRHEFTDYYKLLCKDFFLKF